MTSDQKTIALDAMGGDFAPVETVAGAVLAARESDVAVLLVGDPDALQAQLDGHPAAAVDPRILEAQLPLFTDLGQGQMPRIPTELVGLQLGWFTLGQGRVSPG